MGVFSPASFSVGAFGISLFVWCASGEFVWRIFGVVGLDLALAVYNMLAVAHQGSLACKMNSGRQQIGFGSSVMSVSSVDDLGVTSLIA